MTEPDSEEAKTTFPVTPIRPQDHWEVAYVYAFLTKFTDLRSLDISCLLLNVQSLEEALLTSSPSPNVMPAEQKAAPPSPSSSLTSITSSRNSTKEDSFLQEHYAFQTPLETPVPESSPLLIEILKAFQKNLPEPPDSHARKDWFGWTFRWVKNRYVKFFDSNLQWTHNLMKRPGVRAHEEHEREWWLLTWINKIHLLRVLVDYQLQSSVSIREIITKDYDVHAQHTIKRDPEVNPLVINQIGTVGKLVLWKLDDTARLYSMANPYNSNSSWTVITDTVEEYIAFKDGLSTKEDPADKLARPFQTALRDAEIAKVQAVGKGKSRKELLELETKEKQAKRKLEAGLEAINAHNTAIEALLLKRQKAAERAALREARIAKDIERANAMNSQPRGKRSRKQISYADKDGEDSDEEEDSQGPDNEENDKDDQDEKSVEARIGAKKRKRDVNNDEDAWEEPQEEEEEADEEIEDNSETENGEEAERKAPLGVRRSGRTKNSFTNGKVEWKGERRSGRIQAKALEEHGVKLEDKLEVDPESDGERDRKQATTSSPDDHSEDTEIKPTEVEDKDEAMEVDL